MTRRAFAGVLGGALAASASRSYTLQTFAFADTRQLASMRRWAAKNAAPALMLEALVAPHVPELLIVSNHAMPFPARRTEVVAQGPDAITGKRIFELRCYGGAAPDGGMLRRFGIFPAFSSAEAHLIGFESFAARERAWAALAADARWIQARPAFRVSGISIYRAS